MQLLAPHAHIHPAPGAVGNPPSQPLPSRMNPTPAHTSSTSAAPASRYCIARPYDLGPGTPPTFQRPSVLVLARCPARLAMLNEPCRCAPDGAPRVASSCRCCCPCGSPSAILLLPLARESCCSASSMKASSACRPRTGGGSRTRFVCAQGTRAMRE